MYLRKDNSRREAGIHGSASRCRVFRTVVRSSFGSNGTAAGEPRRTRLILLFTRDTLSKQHAHGIFHRKLAAGSVRRAPAASSPEGVTSRGVRFCNPSIKETYHRGSAITTRA